MKSDKIYPFNIGIEGLKNIQNRLSNKVNLQNAFFDKDIKLCAGVDLAYWKEKGMEWGVCSIIVIDYKTKAFIEKVYTTKKITFPYIPGYLAFRELPLVIRAVKQLSNVPDLFLFDGNGYLHPRHMGLATHASFFLNKPTIGIAKSYFKIHDVDFKMPQNKAGSYENIIVRNEIYGRVLRTHKNVKPIFISCGNYIDLQTTTEITLKLINNESKLPVPVRLADLESRRIRRQMARKRYKR